MSVTVRGGGMRGRVSYGSARTAINRWNNSTSPIRREGDRGGKCCAEMLRRRKCCVRSVRFSRPAPLLRKLLIEAALLHVSEHGRRVHVERLRRFADTSAVRSECLPQSLRRRVMRRGALDDRAPLRVLEQR